MNEAIERISKMEAVLNKTLKKMSELETAITEYEAVQPEIKQLEAYYTSKQWKEDLALDEAGKLPANLKRGILSEDGIYDMLERNSELLERLNRRQD